MLDIIIVNYNSTNYLLNCLKLLKISAKTIPSKIHVQDNASTDNVERILSEHPNVTLVKNHKNLGFSKAVNRALKQGFNKYILLLNPDTYVSCDFIEKSIDFMESNPKMGIMGPKILNSDGGLQNSARAFPTLLTAFFGRTSFLSKWFPGNPITSRNLLSLNSDGKTPMFVDWVSGACMVIRRQAIDKVGLLDEHFFMYWEDADWCKRMWDSGWKVAYFPQVSVCHHVGGSSNKNVYKSSIEFHKSAYRLFKKHRKYIKATYSLAKPMVFTGIFLRLMFVLLFHLIKNMRSLNSARVQNDTDQSLFTGPPKIRILRVISRLNIGGPAIHVHLLTEGLDTERFETTLITGMISPHEGDMSYLFDDSGEKPYIIPQLQREISLGMDVRVIWRILKILNRVKPDVVHTHTAKAGMSARVAVFFYNFFHKQKARTIHTFHGYVFDGYFSRSISILFIWIERFLSKTTDVIIAISSSQKNDLGQKYRIAPLNKIKIIKLGFDLENFLSNGILKGQFRKKLGIDNTTYLIGIIGRLVPIKNHMMFLNAAKIFMMQNPHENVKFVIIGDGELRNHLKNYCIKCGLSKHVIFCGWIKNVSSVYADLNILALTSLNEGTPVSIIEAMASSVPVISTDVGGVSDLLGSSVGVSQDGFKICQRGILCGSNDINGFVSALRYLLYANAKDREKQITDARDFVKKEYAKNHLIKEFETLYSWLATYNSSTKSTFRGTSLNLP